ncbi:MAG: DUF1449 family protein [Anaerolineae bacterium]|nr:DUF1449 family protein [Gloeobacterales cyanobacterium ES-bin-313]
MSWFGWWNLIYIVPGAFGVALAFVAAFGLDEGSSDTDGEPEVEGAISLIGVGRVPLLTWLTMLCIFYGFLGVAANLLLGVRDASNLGLIASAALASAVGSLVLTALFSRLIGRLFPSQESYAGSFASLVGQSGRVVLLISPTEGFAQVRDSFGNLQEVRYRSIEGSPLTKNQSIIVADVVVARSLCLVLATTTDPSDV